MSGRARLVVAAGLCAVALGLGWAATPGSEGYTTAGTITPGFCTSSYDGYLDCAPGIYTAGYYVGGSPEGAARGFEADARVVLVPAVGVLLWASRRRTPTTVRAVAITAAALGVIAVRAAGEGQTAGATVGAVAALLLLSVLRPIRGEPEAGTGPRHLAAPATGPSTAF